MISINWIVIKTKEFFNKHLVVKIFLLSLPCFYIHNRKELGIIHDHLFYTLLWVSSIYVLLDFFFIKKKKVTKLMFPFLIYFAWVFLEQIKAGCVLNDMHISISACAIVFIIETYIKDNPNELLQSFMCIYEPYIYINAISIIDRYVFNKAKIEDLFLVGNRNLFLPYATAAIVVAILYIKNTGKVKRAAVLCLVCLCSMFAIKSATSTVCAILLVLYFTLVFISKKKSVDLKKSLFLIVIIIILLNISFIIYAYNVDGSNILGKLLSVFFQKTSHFTGRTDIWKKSIEIIKEKIIFGYGDEVSIVCFIKKGKFIRMLTAPHAHNAILGILMRFGLFGLLLFSVFSFTYIREIDKRKESIYKDLIIGVFFSFYVYCIMEVCGIFYLFYIMVFLSCHLDDIPDY